MRSEESRLYALAANLDGNPDNLWAAIEDRKPYTRATVWTRVTDFWNWCQARGYTSTNPYAVYREENAKLFKHVYSPRKPTMSYEEARKRIESISNAGARRKALELLASGMRYTESLTRDNEGYVVGKGGRVRETFVPELDGPAFSGKYHELRRELARVGLKPHMLRKLFATKLAAKANEFELCEIMGWSALQTAKAYVNVADERKKRLVEGVQSNGIESDQIDEK